MGTVKFWSKWNIKATRLIGGGETDEVMERVENFSRDVNSVATAYGKPTLEANRAGLCVSVLVRCADMNEVNETIDRFKQNGWKEGN